MRQSTLRTALFAGAAVVALCGVARPASAFVTPPSPSDFQVLESVSGDSGTFTVINNSTDWYVYSFAVGNPAANSNTEQAYTTQSLWSADKSCVSYFGNSSYSNSFAYVDDSNDELGGLATDIAPGMSSNKFTFGYGKIIAFSPVALNLVNGSGGVASFDLNATDVAAPEPASIGLFGMGMLGLWGARRRRRRRRRR